MLPHPRDARGLGGGNGTGLRSLQQAAENLDSHVAWSRSDATWVLTLTGDLEDILGEGYPAV